MWDVIFIEFSISSSSPGHNRVIHSNDLQLA